MVENVVSSTNLVVFLDHTIINASLLASVWVVSHTILACFKQDRVLHFLIVPPHEHYIDLTRYWRMSALVASPWLSICQVLGFVP